MTMQDYDQHSRRALGRRIEDERNARGLTLEQLAAKAGHEVKTVRKLIAGHKVHGSTKANVCKVLGLECTDIRLCESSDEDHGSYSLNTLHDYVGYFHVYRWGFDDPAQILRYIVEISWDDGKKCLHFQEHQCRGNKTSDLDELRDYSQSGDIYFSMEVGLLHLLTVHRGAIRVITLSKYRLGHEKDLTMQGVVLTQAKHPLHYQPCAGPIIFKKLENRPNDAELNCTLLISPEDQGYEKLHRALVDVEKNVAKFALAPDPRNMLGGTILQSVTQNLQDRSGGKSVA